MVPEIDTTQLAAAQEAGYVHLVDVREAREFRTGHVPGARNVPLSLLPLHLATMPRDGRVHVICQAGGRSAQAVSMMRAVGIDAVSVAGGTGAWSDSGRPVQRLAAA
ncbi:rhodanese-like domain-containing protein [Thalassiella azotivora]